MSLKNLICVTTSFLALALLAGCSGSGPAVTTTTTPPTTTTSAYDSMLSGTYIVSIAGYDTTYGEGSFFALAGSLTANGSGTITAGTIDLDDPSLGAALGTGYAQTKLPVTGTYTITSDGRGSGDLIFTVNGTKVEFGIDLVLSSSSAGMISRFDSYGSGSGTINLQTSGLAQSALQGSYAFQLSGADSSVVDPLASAGSMTLDANGNITSGTEDFQDNGSSSGLTDLSLSGTLTVGTPGAAKLTTTANSGTALQFDVWPIDATHLKLIETDGTDFLEGDAFVSTGATAFPSGQLVFSTSGEDTADGPFATGGVLTSDGVSLISSGLEDVNDEGIVQQASTVTGSFTSSGPRTTLTLNGVYNGNFVNNTMNSGSYTFAAYPYTGGVALLEIDGGNGSTLGISGGTLYPQTATSLNGAAGYGLNLTGINIYGEADTIAQFTTNNGSVTGTYDVNNTGYLASDLSLGSGTYTTASNGRGTMTFPALAASPNTLLSSLGLDFYVVNNSTAITLETDSEQVTTGMMMLQSLSSQSTLSTPSPLHPAFQVMHLVPASHSTMGKR